MWDPKQEASSQVCTGDNDRISVRLRLLHSDSLAFGLFKVMRVSKCGDLLSLTCSSYNNCKIPVLARQRCYYFFVYIPLPKLSNCSGGAFLFASVNRSRLFDTWSTLILTAPSNIIFNLQHYIRFGSLSDIHTSSVTLNRNPYTCLYNIHSRGLTVLFLKLLCSLPWKESSTCRINLFTHEWVEIF